MEKKMYARQAFKCSVCNNEYDNALDRAHCELACLKRQEEEAKKAAQLKKQEEQKARHAKVTELIDAACAALTEYIELYGEYEYESSEEADELDALKLLHYFMF